MNFTSIFLFSLFIFYDISTSHFVCVSFSTNFLVPVTFPSAIYCYEQNSTLLQNNHLIVFCLQ